MTVTDLVLSRLTDASLIDLTRRQTAPVWRGRLCGADYVTREELMAKSDLSTKAGYLVFALHPQDDPAHILCSVELMLRPAWRVSVENGVVTKKNITSGGITAVFTPEENRGKGYARVMMDKLVEVSQSNYVGSDGFLMLYSEVGEYYAKSGFKSFEVPMTHVPLQPNSTTCAIPSDCTLHPVKFGQFAPLFDEYIAAEEARIKREVKSDGKTRVCIDPTNSYVDWFHCRSKYTSHRLNYLSEPVINYDDDFQTITANFEDIEPHVFGLKLVHSSGATVGFVVWTYEWQVGQNYISILSLYVCPGFDKDAYSCVLFDACKQFVERSDVFATITNDLTKISIWQLDTPEALLKHIKEKHNGKTDNVNPSVSCAMMMNSGDNDKLARGELVWDLNNKLPWF